MLFVIIIILFFGCEEYQKSSDSVLQRQTEQSMKEANSQIGMPAIKNFQERKLAKMIFELRDQENLITYAYIVNLEGKLIFLGKCVGYGLPYSVQYTNPEKVINLGSYKYSGDSPQTIPQADPNGLFMPSGLSATWLMLIDPKTDKPRPVYIEPEIIVSPFKLK
jgi:hypothetical protein